MPDESDDRVDGFDRRAGDARRLLIGLPRSYKRVLVVVNDLVCLAVAMWLVFSVRFNAPYIPETVGLGLMLTLAPVLGVVAFGWFGAYRLVTRYVGPETVVRIIGLLGLSVLVWSLLVLITGIGVAAHGYGVIPRSAPLAYFIVGSSFLLGSRSLAAWLLYVTPLHRKTDVIAKKSVVIYGAGSAGLQVRDAMVRTGTVRVAAFFDDEENLWGQYVAGAKVYPPQAAKIARVLERELIKDVVVAVPHLPRRRQQEILKLLQQFPVRVQILPSIADLASGRVTINDLRPVQVEDLLGRDLVPADRELLAKGIRSKSVLVTGAGGSIGSELVRQIARQAPSKLVLLELSEPALYEIETEITENAAAPPVVGVLGSVLDRMLLQRLMAEHEIDVIFHAAAYKHVPIVEANPAIGILNNTFGTEIVAEVAREHDVERVVLISTDKAVRPTNVMGASKRLAELILQAHAADPSCRTIFSMVRFGNVLDSSGSVVRRFRRQIAEGGPITVTHPDITRYFMSIPEAAELVVQAGAMAKGGDVFLLEMGEPVRILDLAHSMVRLVGLDVRTEENPDGDIDIVFTGLRPGEKLYEELLIGPGAIPTDHPRIVRHNEPHLDMVELQSRLDLLRQALARNDLGTVQAILRSTVEGYGPADPSYRQTGVTGGPVSRALH